MKYLMKLESFVKNKTYLKTYEQNIGYGPKIGDYVICEENIANLERKKYTSENIGKFVSDDGGLYVIVYKNVPKKLKSHLQFNGPEMGKGYYALMFKEEIIHWSKNKKDLEIFLDIKKYNL